MATNDATLREAERDAGATQIYNALAAQFGAPGRPSVFRGMPIVEQLPTKGAEADIFIVNEAGERRVLKLYRHRMEPKIEVLNRVAAVSRANRRYFVEFFDTGFDEAAGRWYELQEYMPLGSLKDTPDEVKRAPNFIAGFVSELAGAIHCLHESEIIHCDIKPANILIRALDPLDAVLTDFGISSLLAADMSQKMTSLKGTPMYWAPEAFSREIGRPCDWWGMGMILLELLAGEHPFEGMSDSQMIHRLTLGNVDIPAAIDPAWATLLKGLLTKDDARRWGMSEIGRWASGDRDVPVHYSRGVSSPEGLKPFQFEGADYRDEEALARAFAASEAAWLASLGYLHYLRGWFEANLRFDEAMRIGQAEASGDPELAFFRFIHRNARLPFSVLAREVDLRSLADCLARVVNASAATSDRRIAEMLYAGKILAYYDEYVAISGSPPDGPLRAALALLVGKSREDQAAYLAALLAPGDFLWPDGTDVSGEGAAEALGAMGRAPMRRDFWAYVAGKYTLPKELVEMINHGPPADYATAASTLESWSKMDMLLENGPSWERGDYGELGMEDYERTARSMILGHTPAALRQMSQIADDLDAMFWQRDTFSTPSVAAATERVRCLRYRKVRPNDTAFLVGMTRLLEEREKRARARWVNYPTYALAAGAATLSVHPTAGRPGDFFLRALLALSALLTAGLFYCATRFERRIGETSAMSNFIWMYCVGVFSAIAFLSFGNIMDNLPNALSFFTGAAPAFTIQFAVDSARFAANSAKIIETCAWYEGAE